LAATNVTNSSFTANWNSVPGAEDYLLEVSASSNFSSIYATRTSTGTSVEVTSLGPGTFYYYRVRARKAPNVSSSNSNIITVGTLVPAPVAYAATAISANSFTANWQAATGSTGYAIDVSTASDFSSFVTGYNNLSLPGGQFSTVINNVSPITTYYYRLRATSNTGPSVNSNVITVLTVPAVPVATAATNIAETSFTANWNSVTGASAYRLDVSSSSDFSTILTEYDDLSVTGTSRSITGLSGGSTYYYRVRAHNASGSSANSNVVSLLLPPQAPVANAATGIGPNAFEINWSLVPGATGYVLDLSTESDFSSFVLGYNNVSTSTFTGIDGNIVVYNDILPGVTYYYRLRAVNSAGQSANSNVVSVLTAPAAPLATVGTNVTNSSFTANWNSVPGASAYHLDVSTSNSFSTILTEYDNLSVTGTSTSITGLSAGATYYYRVRASNVSGSSDNSNVVSLLLLPQAPVANAATDVGPNVFEINWSLVPGATGYVLDLSTENDFSSFVPGGYEDVSTSNFTGIDGNIVVYNNISSATTYYYRLRAVNGAGQSANSNVVSVLTVPVAPIATEATSITGSSFMANWNSVPGAEDYLVEVSNSSTFTNLHITLAVPGLSAEVTGVGPPGAIFYYRVRARNASGSSSANSNVVSVGTLVPAPVAYAATNISSNSFTANWQPATGSTGYAIDASEEIDFSSFLEGFEDRIFPLSVNSTPVSSNISPNTTYYYRLRATSDTGPSVNSNVITVLSLLRTPVALPATNVNSYSFTANWNSTPDATEYHFDVSTANDFSSFLPGYNDLIVTENNKYITDLDPEITYYYRVRTSSASNHSLNSSTITVTTPGMQPADYNQPDFPFSTSNEIGSLPGTAGVSPSGSATYTIPIAAPLGTAGMQPNLSIVYSSQAGNGMLGQGWSISGFSSITRTGTNLHDDGYIDGVDFDEYDQFALDGNRLVSVGSSEYRTQMETFAKITSSGSIADDPASFVVETKDGKKLYYGSSSASRFLASDKSPKPVLVWLLDKAEDANGNYYTISYEIRNNEYYPKEVKYTMNDGAGMSAYNSIKFHFDIKDKNEQTTAYISGSKIKSTVILRDVVVEHENNLAWKYSFKYKHDWTLSSDIRIGSPNLHDFYLSEILRSDGSGKQINSTKFTMGAKQYRGVVQSSDIQNLGDFYPGDYNGDGQTDLVIAVYKRDSNGDIVYAPTFYPEPEYYSWNLYTANDDGITFTHERTHMMNDFSDNFSIFFPGDFDGDGKTDLFRRSYNKYYLYLSQGNSYFTKIELNHPARNYIKSLDRLEKLDVGDFNGDGKTDWVIMKSESGTILEDGPNTVEIFTYDPSSTDKFRKLHFLDVTVGSIKKHLVADFNGNGKTDLMLISKNNDANSSKIYEFGGPPIPVYDAGGNIMSYMPDNDVHNTSTSGFPTKDHIIYPGDFNGDEKTDLYTYHPTNKWEFHYSSGDVFVEGQPLNSDWAAPSGDNYFDGNSWLDYTFNYSVADYNGDGKDDMLKQYFQKGSGPGDISYARFDYVFVKDLSTDNLSYEYGAEEFEGNYISFSTAGQLDFNGDGKAEFLMGSDTYTDNRKIVTFGAGDKRKLISSIKNGFDDETKFEYLSLTDDDVHEPGTDEGDDNVAEIRPPLTMVHKMYKQNGLGVDNFNTYTFKYSGLKVHLRGKGMLGFEKVLNTDNFGKSNESVYDFDPTFYNVRLASNKVGYDAKFQQVTYTNNTVAKNNNKSYINYVDKVVSYDDNSEITTTTDYLYDDYGNIEEQTIDYDGEGTTTITNTYVQTKGWCPSAINTSEVVKVRGAEVPYTRTIDNDYDADGNLITITTDESYALKKLITNISDYNAFGFPETVEVEGSGITKTTTKKFDVKGRFVTEETVVDPEGDDFVSSLVYDYKLGKVTSSTDAQGKTTSFTYDSFGRLTKTTLPNEHEIEQTVDWVSGHDELNPPTNAWYYTESTQNGSGYARAYYDILGRKLREETQGFDGTPIFKDFVYNLKGQILKTTDPYFDGDIKNTSITYYDDYDRIDRVVTPYGNITYDNSVAKKVQITYPGNEWKTKKNTSFGDLDWVEDDGGKIDYEYYSSGLVKSTITDGSGIISFEYDLHGNRTKMTDPNAGVINNTYDAFGSQLTHIDEKGSFTMEYDKLSRLKKKTGLDGITDYIYEKTASANGFGQLEQVTYGTYIQDYVYDGYDKLMSAKETIEGTTFEYKYTYDGIGRVETTTYPKGKNGSTDFVLTNVYNNFGYLQQIKRNGQTLPVWQADVMNAVGQYKQITKGNLITNYEFDDYHRPASIVTTGVLEYTYNFERESGNLLSRTDNTKNRGLIEMFTYDNLDRVEYGYSKIGVAPEIERLYMQYANNGNINSKSDVGTYTYDATKLHFVKAITELAPDVAIPSADQIINYTAFKKVADIAEDGNTLTFTYGPDYQRRKTVFDNGSGVTKTKYFMGNYEEIEDNSGNYRKLYYIPGGDALAGVYIVNNSEAYMYYTYADYLGSILAITNDAGELQQEQRFDAWGRRRNLDEWLYTSISTIDIINRGYTFHEHLNEFGIINMNGRLYDPVVGRMLSPDPQLQNPGYTQNYNRYSYVYNNPLKYTDPSGESILAALGTIARMYVDGAMANGFEWNPLDWNWGSANTWNAMYEGYHAGKAVGADWERSYNSLFGGDGSNPAMDNLLEGYAIGDMDLNHLKWWLNSGAGWGEVGYAIAYWGNDEYEAAFKTANFEIYRGFRLNDLIPVAKSISIDVDIVPGGGMDWTPIGIGTVFKGKDRGKLFGYTSIASIDNLGYKDLLWAYGFDMSVSLKETNYWYVGNIDNFSIQSFNGYGYEFNLAGTVLADFGITIGTMEPDPVHGGYLIYVGFSVGVGVPSGMSGNINKNQTKAWRL